MKHIEINRWGKDHWSTLAYVETLAVDADGLAKPDPQRMRTNAKTHGFTGGAITQFGSIIDGSKYPTKLKDGEVKEHDDWDCLDDTVREGLLEDIGTGINRAFKFTKTGMKIAAELRQHKQNGGVFHNFIPSTIKNSVVQNEPRRNQKIRRA